jgi:hypothetical protein
MSDQMTEGELQQYYKFMQPSVQQKTQRNISEHKKSVISKFSNISEAEIDALERLPEHLFSKVSPDRFRVLKSDMYALVPSRGAKRKDVILVKAENERSPSTIAHEFGHLILEHSNLLNNKEFVKTAEKLFMEEFENTKKDFNERFKKVTEADGKPITDFFSHVFRNNGRGNHVPSKLNNITVALFGKKIKDCKREKIDEMDTFLDSLLAVSHGDYGSGHKKGYIKERNENNHIHEFFANTMSAMVTGNQTMNRFFPKSMRFMNASVKTA